MNNKNEVKNDDILNMIVQEDNIDTEAIIKCELFLERIFFPKYVKSVDSGEFAIFSGYITKRIENCPETLESIKLKGTVPTLEYGTTYKVFAKFESHHDLYGDTYSIIYMNKCVDISSKDKQKEFLRCVLNENLVEKLFEKYEDVIELLENKDVEALTSVKGIGNQVALKMIDEYNCSKDYSQVYIELGQMGFTDNFIRKLVEFYHSPDVAIDKVKNNPYDLVRIDGVGFKKADEIGCKAGIDKFSPHRIKAFLYYTLDEQGEAGRSYLLYQELMKSMYDTLGFIPEEVISEVAKRMIDNGEIVVLDNGNKISLKKYYNLEKNIMNELIRLQIGKIDIVETEEYKDEDYIESELHKDYVPKIFNTSDWEDKVKKIEEVQGFEFTDEQKAAIELSINNNVIAITGGAGCVDCDTEFFNGYQWKKISEYNSNDKVLQYNKDGTAELVYPSAYIKQKADYLWHFETKYGLDQCLSDKHNCYYITSKNNLYHKTFKEVRENQEKNGFDGRFITSFKYEDTGINLSDFEIRLMIAIFADGSFYYNVTDEKDVSYNTARFHLKKERKKQRLLYILNNLEKMCRVKESAAEGYTDFYITAPFRAKHFPVEWYKCNKHQKEIIMDEVLQWDSYYKEKNGFCTTDKSDADFIQFVFTSLGYRSTICTNDRRGRIRKINGKEYVTKSIDYVVSYYKNILVGMCSDNRPNYHKTQIEKYKTSDGYEYCFTVPSHILVLRRNDKIFITGNCGKSSVAKGVCNIYTHPSIVACALSGKAALRITEATGLAASTIHRALGWYQGEFTYNKNNKLPADIVLIDEATMINGYLFHSLLQAIPIGCKVIILGDVQQLTPIGNCQVFADILDANIIPCVRLTKIHRQAAKSGIIPTSIKIAHQEQIFENNYVGNSILGELQDMEFDITSDKDNLADKVISHFQTEMNKFNEIMEVQICVAKRLDGNLSCYNLNNRIQEIYNPVFGKDNNNSFEIALESKKNKDEIKKYVIRVGDKVINVKNNYRCATPDGGETAVFNGNMGIVKDITDKGIVKIDFAGIGEVLFDKSSRNALELGYACTIHKCVTADTIVYSDKGLITIDELNNGAKELENKEITTDIKIYNGNYMEKPLNFYNAGLTKCKKIITSRGYKLIATNDHRVDVLDTDGYIVTKHISDVTDDDYMILSVGSNVYGNSIKLNYSVDEKELDKRAKIYKYPKYMTKEFARFLGYMVADGTISQCGLAYGKNHKNVVIDFDNIVYQLFGYDRGTEPTNVLPDGVLGGMYLSAINSKYIKKYCEQIEGIQPNNKFVPKVILSSPKEYQIEFLRGVFEDGSVCVKNDKFDHISFTCKEEKTVDQINMMLLNMGIICTKYHRKTEIYDSYTLFIYGEYCDKFIKTIGFISNEKSERAFKYYEIEHGQSERKSIPYVINVISDIANDKGIKLRDIHRELLRAKRRNTMTKSLLGKVLNWFNEKGINDLRIDYLRSIYENMYFDKIKSIEEVEEHTYCIEMPITHRFIQNGFYGWNCQGSGFLSTIVGMSTDSFIMNNSELLYTGITRAKKYCILVGNNYAISKAIKTKEVKNKQTFLRDMLIENKDRLKGD